VLPLLAITLVPAPARVAVTIIAVLAALAVTGAATAALGRAPRLPAVLRNVAGGAVRHGRDLRHRLTHRSLRDLTRGSARARRGVWAGEPKEPALIVAGLLAAAARLAGGRPPDQQLRAVLSGLFSLSRSATVRRQAKTSRVVEVLLAHVPARSLLADGVLGSLASWAEDAQSAAGP